MCEPKPQRRHPDNPAYIYHEVGDALAVGTLTWPVRDPALEGAMKRVTILQRTRLNGASCTICEIRGEWVVLSPAGFDTQATFHITELLHR